MDTYLGIDYGGTKLLIGEVDREGKILSCKRFETGKKTQKEIAVHLERCLREYMEISAPKGRIQSAGLGIVGICDYERGIWKSINHEKGKDIPLAEKISDILELPTVIDNDVRCGTIAQFLWGCGKISDNFIYISVGTGLGAGFVIDGRIVRGSGHNAGEIGHMSLEGKKAPKCVCGRRGCAELTVSGMGIDRNIRVKQKYFSTRLAIPEERVTIRTEEVFSLAEKGDPLCKKVTEEAEEALAQVIGNLARVMDPDTIVLGGGLMQNRKFFEGVLKRLVPSAVRGVTKGVRLSELEPGKIGLLGAAALGRLYIEEQKGEIL